MRLPASDRLEHAPSLGAPKSPIMWRELRRGLWVGRAGDTHAGIIEQGRRFTVTDADGNVHRGFTTLAAAQTATGSMDLAAVPAASSSSRLAARRAIAGAARWIALGVAVTALHAVLLVLILP